MDFCCIVRSLRSLNTLPGQTTLSKVFCLPSENGSTHKRKNLLPWGAGFFPFIADQFSEGNLCAGKQTGSHNKNCPLAIKIGGNSSQHIWSRQVG